MPLVGNLLVFKMVSFAAAYFCIVIDSHSKTVCAVTVVDPRPK